MTRAIPWSALVLQADPEHAREKRFTREYEFSSKGPGTERTHKEGRRVFEADYQDRGVYAYDWTSAAAFDLDESDPAWQGYTLAQVIGAAALTTTGGNLVRLTLRGGLDKGFDISEAYLGHAALSGNAYDFETTPVPVLLDGQRSFRIPAGQTVLPVVNFEIIEGRNLVFTAYCAAGAGAADTVRASDAVEGDEFWLFGYEPATLAKSADYGGHADTVAMVEKIEVFK
jgi:hypothetical protein